MSTIYACDYTGLNCAFKKRPEPPIRHLYQHIQEAQVNSPMAIDHQQDPAPMSATPPISPNGRLRDAAAIRAHRNLAAARVARTGITTMVDNLRIAKPPRVPPKGAAGAAAMTARRHALIPLAEGREQLETRIHHLEDTVAARDESLVTLKQQLGRALVKRRHLDRERETLVARLAQTITTARSYQTLITSSRGDLNTLIDDVSSILRSAPRQDGAVALTWDDLTTAVEIATDKLKDATPPSQLDTSAIPPPVGAPGQFARRARASGGLSTIGSDDDTKSCASFTSSALGDDREAQLDSLVELVEILDAKLSCGPPHARAANAVQRARRTVVISRAQQPDKAGEERRDQLSKMVAEILAERGRQDLLGHGDGNAKDDFVVEVALREANVELEDMRERMASLEKMATRGLRSEDIVERNGVLEMELANAKRTVTRMIQERQTVRRRNGIGMASGQCTPVVRTPVKKGETDAIAGGDGGLALKSLQAGKLAKSGDSDAMQRVLDWRQSTSGDGAAEIHEEGQGLETTSRTRSKRRKSGDDDGRSTGAAVGTVGRGAASGVSAVAVGGEGGDEVAVFGVSEKSFDPFANDTASGQSIPVRGFLQRHDSFLSGGDVMSSTNGDEITIMKPGNIFNVGARRADGLRGLLGL